MLCLRSRLGELREGAYEQDDLARDLEGSCQGLELGDVIPAREQRDHCARVPGALGQGGPGCAVAHHRAVRPVLRQEG
eukprot:11283709-Alexandrium_andersonii.AAC.1